MSDTSEVVKWIFTVQDVISGPVRGSILALAGLDRQFNTSTKQLSEFERALHMVNLTFAAGQKFWGTASSGLGKMTDLAGGAASVILKAADAAKDVLVDAGKMAWEGFAYREEAILNMKTQFKEMAGSEENAAKFANDLFDHAIDVAKKTKFEQREVIGMYRDLLKSGFSTSELDTVVSAIADVSTLEGTEAGKSFTLAIRKMKEAKRTTFGAWQQAGMAGPGVPYKGIAPMLGLDPNMNEVELSKAVRKKMLQGVGSDIGIKSILEEVRRVYEAGQPLGTIAIAQAQTLTGVWSNFKEAFSSMFMSSAFQKVEGFTTLKQALMTITNLFDVNTPRGERLMNVMSNITNDFLSMIGITPETAGAAFDQIVNIAEKLELVIRKITSWIRDVMLPAFGKMITTEGGFTAAVKNALISLGKWVGVGIAEGMKHAALGVFESESDAEKEAKAAEAAKEKKAHEDRTYENQFAGIPSSGPFQIVGMQQGQNAGDGLAAGTTEGLKTSLDAHSPSRVTRDIGRQAGQDAGSGLALGMRDGLRSTGPASGPVFTGPVYLSVEVDDAGEAGIAQFRVRLAQSIRDMSRAPGRTIALAPRGNP